MIKGERLPRLGYELGIGVDAYLNDHVTLGTSIMGSYRKDYQEYTGFVRLKYDF